MHVDEAAAAERGPRRVASFVRRSPRMTASQQKAWQRWRERYVLDLPHAQVTTDLLPQPTLDAEQVWGRRAPLAVEIGSGAGENLVAMAGAHPDWNLLAFEVYERSVAATMIRLAAEGIDNVRLVMADGRQGLEHLVAPGALQELWTFFPDPWHKKRHHKRRLVTDEFAGLVASRLAPGGVWRLATDWDDYALAIREVLDARLDLVNPHAVAGSSGWAPRCALRPLTKYELRGIHAGRSVHDLVYQRVPV